MGLLLTLKLADFKLLTKASRWITISCQTLAYVRKFTYLSAAEKSNKEHLPYGKGKHKISINIQDRSAQFWYR